MRFAVLLLLGLLLALPRVGAAMAAPAGASPGECPSHAGIAQVEAAGDRSTQDSSAERDCSVTCQIVCALSGAATPASDSMAALPPKSFEGARPISSPPVRAAGAPFRPPKLPAV